MGRKEWAGKNAGKVPKMGVGVDRCTPGYLVREEMQRELLRGRAGLRAWRYEKKLIERKGGELARPCLEELKRKEEKGGKRNKWEEERANFLMEGDEQ